MQIDYKFLQLLSLPIISTFLGWGTNYLAVKMIFRPRAPINIFGFKLQGLLPRRQREFAANIADTIQSELVSERDVMAVIESNDVKRELHTLLETKVDDFTKGFLASNPMLAMFCSQDLLLNIKTTILQQLEASLPEMIGKLSSKVEDKLDFKRQIREKVEQFDLETLERIIYKIANKELKAIEYLGGVIGLIVGVVQVGLYIL